MGGGDLNMKKSWHPLLLKNQERVWLEEQKAREEKKKLDQLRKEKEEERQLQELQRLQEEKTGKKKTEKLEWMYATPATGSNQNANDLEDYLLGKKRVDKILIADDNAKLGATHKNFIAVQNANTARDIAAKIREDPLLAIKQQEQAAYQALLSNPLRLRELQEKTGIKIKKDKKDKHKHKHGKKKERRKSDGQSPEHRHRSRRSPSQERNGRSTLPFSYDRRRSLSYERRRSYDRGSRSRSPLPRYNSSRDDDDRHHALSRGRSRSRSPPLKHRRSRSRSRDLLRRRENGRPKGSDESDDSRSRSLDRGYDRKRRRSPSPAPYSSYSKRSRMTPPPRPPVQNSTASEDRSARLAAMTTNATELTVDRQKRLKAMLEAEVAEAEREKKARERNGEMGGFLGQEAKKVFGGITLEDRMKRGRGGMVVDAE